MIDNYYPLLGISIPPANKIWGGGGLFWNYVVCLSINLCNHVQSLSFIWRNIVFTKFLLHTKITYDLRVCHNFDPRSFWQVQGH